MPLVCRRRRTFGGSGFRSGDRPGGSARIRRVLGPCGFATRAGSRSFPAALDQSFAAIQEAARFREAHRLAARNRVPLRRCLGQGGDRRPVDRVTKVHVRAGDQVACLVDVVPVRQQLNAAHVDLGASSAGHAYPESSGLGDGRLRPPRTTDDPEISGESALPAARLAGVPPRPLQPRLPAHRGPGKHPVVRAVDHRTLTALRLDPQLERQALPVQHAEAVAEPVVPPRFGGPEADPRSSSRDEVPAAAVCPILLTSTTLWAVAGWASAPESATAPWRPAPAASGGARAAP